MILYLCQNLFCKEFLYGFGRNRVEYLVHSDADALLALTHAESTAQLHLVANVMLCNKLLERGYDLAGALNVAGATDTNNNFHHDCIPL